MATHWDILCHRSDGNVEAMHFHGSRKKTAHRKRTQSSFAAEAASSHDFNQVRPQEMRNRWKKDHDCHQESDGFINYFSSQLQPVRKLARHQFLTKGDVYQKRQLLELQGSAHSTKRISRGTHIKKGKNAQGQSPTCLLLTAPVTINGRAVQVFHQRNRLLLGSPSPLPTKSLPLGPEQQKIIQDCSGSNGCTSAVHSRKGMPSRRNRIFWREKRNNSRSASKADSCSC